MSPREIDPVTGREIEADGFSTITCTDWEPRTHPDPR